MDLRFSEETSLFAMLTANIHHKVQPITISMLIHFKYTTTFKKYQSDKKKPF